MNKVLQKSLEDTARVTIKNRISIRFLCYLRCIQEVIILIHIHHFKHQKIESLLNN